MRSRLFRLFAPGLCLACLYVLFQLGACRKKQIVQENYLSKEFRAPVWRAVTPELLRLSLRLRLENKIPAVRYHAQIAAWYGKNGYNPVLLARFLSNHQLDTLIGVLGKAPEHGFSERRFGARHLARRFQELHLSSKGSRIDAVNELSAFELELVSALLSYGHDLGFGELDPSNLYKSRFSIKLKKPDSSFYDSLFSSKDLAATLRGLEPKSALYRTMKDSLHRFREESVGQGSQQSGKIALLRINMERLRWRHLDTASTYALVNIPSFRLYAFEHGELAWSMGVCVGEHKQAGYDEQLAQYRKSGKIDDRPSNHQTPLLTSVFSSIQLNPKWNIPSSILQNELYYKLRRNPNYLAENNMKLYRGNHQVGRLDTIRWDRIARDKIPFSVKQDPGEYNALGKIKFTFNNPYSIYLHDTPTRSPFRRAVRDVSHGCVRLENPLRLAEWLAGPNGKYAYDLIRINLGLKPTDSSEHILKVYEQKQQQFAENGSQQTTSTVNLKKKVPVFIEYYTCWAEKGQGLSFLRDVYQLDGVIQKNLQD